jgi:hypothetical protein
MSQIKINCCIDLLRKTNNFLVEEIENCNGKSNHMLYFEKYNTNCVQSIKSNKIKSSQYFYLEM